MSYQNPHMTSAGHHIRIKLLREENSYIKYIGHHIRIHILRWVISIASTLCITTNLKFTPNVQRNNNKYLLLQFTLTYLYIYCLHFGSLLYMDIKSSLLRSDSQSWQDRACSSIHLCLEMK